MGKFNYHFLYVAALTVITCVGIISGCQQAGYRNKTLQVISATHASTNTNYWLMKSLGPEYR